MFSIIISEKGGAERRESFDKAEINVGRVQGNDLVLPKGNVSKHHARLLFRDGRFIVTDLKSTNGTYVNGRKIAQATIVRDGDKVYIGDFVLRVDSPGAPAEEGPSGAHPQDIPTMSRDNPVRMANQAPLGTAQGLGASGALQTPGMGPNAGMGMGGGMGAPAGPPGGSGMGPGGMPPGMPPGRNDVGGPPPTMHAASRPGTSPPRQPSTAGMPAGMPPLPPEPPPDAAPPINDFQTSAVPEPPQQRRSVPPRAHTMPLDQKVPRPGSLSPLTGEPARRSAPPTALAGSETEGPPPEFMGSSRPPPLVAPVQRNPERAAPPILQKADPSPAFSPGLSPKGPDVAIAPQVTKDKDGSAQAGRRLALLSLLTRVAKATDVSLVTIEAKDVSRLERVARDQASQMSSAGDVPMGADVERLVQEAMSELVSLGPLSSLLDDDRVTEVHCVRYDQILVRRGGELERHDLAFSSDAAVRRVVMRLASEMGKPVEAGEVPVERHGVRGFMVAFLPPASHACALSFQKTRTLDRSFEDLVRQNQIARNAAAILEAAMAARVNVLVCGQRGTTDVVAGLSSLARPGERVCVVRDAEDLSFPQGHVVSLSPSASSILGAVRMLPDRLFALALGSEALFGLTSAVHAGVTGVVVAVPAATLEQALSRAVAQCAAHASIDSATAMVASAFDLAVELETAADGFRIRRVAELEASEDGVVARDVLAAQGNGPLQATGYSPRLLETFQRAGITFDSAAANLR